jgi:hypothetical protein
VQPRNFESDRAVSGHYGPSIENGTVNYFSATQLKIANGCLRAWHWQYVSKKPKRESLSFEIGKVVHAELERYLRDDVDCLGPIARSALPFLKQKSLWTNVLVEQEVENVTLAGVKFVGKIDLSFEYGGYNWIYDHKTASTDNYRPTSHDLANDLQLAIYAVALGNRRTIVGHSIMQTKKRGHGLVHTSDLPLDHFKEVLDSKVALARQIISSVLVTDSNQVTCNTNHCEAYGGCHHKSYCDGWQEKTLDDIFGKDFDMTRFNIKPELEALKKAENSSDPVRTEALDLFARLDRCNTMPGYPAIGSAIAPYFAAHKKYPTVGQAYAGSGSLGNNMLNSIEDLREFTSEIEVEYGNKILAPDAPISKPESVAQSAQRDTVEIPEEAPKKPRRSRVAESAMPDVVEVVAVAPSVLEKRARRSQSIEITESVKPQVEVVNLVATTSHQVFIFVDCTPSNLTLTPLQPWIDAFFTELNESSGLADVRLADTTHKLGYNKWKVALSALARDREGLQCENYFVSGSSEITQAVLEGLSARAGVIVVRSLK